MPIAATKSRLRSDLRATRAAFVGALTAEDRNAAARRAAAHILAYVEHSSQSPSPFPLGHAERTPSLSRREREGGAQRRKGEGDVHGSTTTIAGYIAVGDELDPGPLLDLAARRGLTLALPHVTARDQPMRFLRWHPGDPLSPGPFGLSQPMFDAAEIVPDLIVTPLLGFDRSGGRIGQGAGFYDRAFLAFPFARRIGLAWSVQEVASLPLDPWDVPLHAIATERDWIEFPGVR